MGPRFREDDIGEAFGIPCRFRGDERRAPPYLPFCMNSKSWLESCVSAVLIE